MAGRWVLGVSLVMACGAVWSVRGMDTLFSFDDPITQLTRNNFTRIIHASPTAWAVDFYASWCGHCQRFAPVWVKLAYDVHAWRRVVRVASLACSDPNNAKVCEKYGIFGYPTVKFFSAFADDEYRGQNYDGSKEKLRQGLIDFLEYLPANKKPETMPDMTLLSSLDDFGARKDFSFVIYENTTDTDDAYVGKEVILDMSLHENVRIRRMDQNAGQSVPVTKYPAVYQIQPDKSLRHIVSGKDRSEIVKHLTAIAVKQTQTQPPTTSSQVFTTKPTVGYPDGLHMQDLESSLYYSLWLEVAKRRAISGPALEALKNHLAMLAKYHPGKAPVTTFLKRLSRWLKRQQSPLDGTRWKNKLNRMAVSNAYIPKLLRWTGCQGSAPRYRGYPCSLWMTFHALTVNAYLKDGRTDEFKPAEVLTTIREYIRNFFGCRECAGHFTNMSAHVEAEVHRGWDGVMWLWKGHNRVNARLHGDTTEDPQHPKVQFPIDEACPSCRRSSFSDFWREASVKQYLLNFYGPQNIIQDALAYTPPTSAPTTPPTTSPAPTEVRTTPAQPECVRITTPWSSCSRSCGTGLSSRMSNDNPRCKTKREYRICTMRPCTYEAEMESCNKTLSDFYPKRIQYGYCRTMDQYRLKYCGACPGKCCYPVKSHTVMARFYCGWMRAAIGRIWIIDACACAPTCPDDYTDTEAP